ncbi:MAG TPA: TRAP transporter small permease [Sphaerochaeta sp.]|nr:TRAP transporter small permease [Sphaerochaeta sp.]
MGALLNRLYKNLEVILSACFLSITVGVVILNVILRYVFDGGLFWIEEVATTAFLWSVFIGSAAAYKRKMHIGIDLITKLFPERVREVISSVINVLMAVINGYVCYLSILMINANKLKRTPVLDVPAMYINLAITVGFGLMTIHSIQFLITEGILLVRGRRDLPRMSS